jgi:hypothetical protein
MVKSFLYSRRPRRERRRCPVRRRVVVAALLGFQLPVLGQRHFGFSSVRVDAGGRSAASAGHWHPKGTPESTLTTPRPASGNGSVGTFWAHLGTKQGNPTNLIRCYFAGHSRVGVLASGPGRVRIPPRAPGQQALGVQRRSLYTAAVPQFAAEAEPGPWEDPLEGKHGPSLG